MLPAFLAFSILKGDSSSLGGGLADKTQIDYLAIAINIFLKFIDVLEAVGIVIATLFLIRLLKKYFERIETTHEQQRTGINLLQKISSGFMLVVGITLALKVVGLDLTMLISVLLLGLSFGIRDVLKNYVAGLLILIKAPFKIGDVIKIRSFTGHVERIEFQAVTMRTFDRKEITLNNSIFLTQPLTNFSRTEQARLEIIVSLGYGTDMHRALTIFAKILNAHEKVLKQPKYSIVFKSFGQNSSSVQIRFWVTKPANVLRIRSELALQINNAFDETTVFAPYAREAGLEGTYGMTTARTERLKLFYGQPILADLAAQTLAQVDAATQPVAEEYADSEEPE